ncbi:site-specific integrase [Curvibacter delicatus]|uniref:site-specific integrase n=1 Tax=Curvibacter delicatus TaxID=80879 RepID=UPI000AB66D25|nr:site-specific integrase [Curvibacter delicatus]
MKVCYSDIGVTTKAGFGKVAHLPFILDSRPGYHRLASQYLIDRGLGVWSPETRGKGRRSNPLSRQTVKNYAHWLANFLEWAEVRDVPLATCNYADHLQDRYQSEMLSGIWSRNRAALTPVTVNLRVQQACDFLTWMHDKGHRGPFEFLTESARFKAGGATSAVGFRAIKVERRIGKVRQNKRRLRMPTEDEVRTWLKSVYENSGYSLGLACETILLTGLRIEEVASLRVDSVPIDMGDWHLSNADAPKSEQQVLIDVKYGTKGPDYGEDNGDKIGPVRTIHIPLLLAEKVDSFRLNRRNLALRKWINQSPDPRERKSRIGRAVHLFLNESTGGRVTSDNIYRAWKNGALPFDGWRISLLLDFRWERESPR